VAATRRAGIGIDPGNYINGVTVIAAPVLDVGGVMSHGLVAVGVSERLDPASVEAVGAALREAARTLSARDADRR
jgi:DNA-binding IclR family transcriptional regulator